MKFFIKSIFSVFIGSRLLIFLFYEKIHLIMHESLVMLYYTAFYEMTHRPYILESYIIDIFALSFSPPSIYPHTFLLPNLEPHNSKSDWFFYLYAKKDFSCYNDMANILYLD